MYKTQFNLSTTVYAIKQIFFFFTIVDKDYNNFFIVFF